MNENDIVQLSSIIHQNIYMFNESVYDNICLHEDYSKESIDKAVKASGLNDVIEKLPEGYSMKQEKTALIFQEDKSKGLQ